VHLKEAIKLIGITFPKPRGYNKPGMEELVDFGNLDKYDPWDLCKLVDRKFNCRVPEFEPYIIKNPEAAVYYAETVLKRRWPEAELYIMKDPWIAYQYAKDVIKDRWPEAEPVIIKDPITAHHYARDVIEGPWPEAELHIKEDPEAWDLYKSELGLED